MNELRIEFTAKPDSPDTVDIDIYDVYLDGKALSWPRVLCDLKTIKSLYNALYALYKVLPKDKP